MANLVSAAVAKVQLGTSLSDGELDAIIEREEAAIIERYGAHYVDTETTISEVHLQEADMPRYADLFLGRPILSVSTVTENATLTSAGVALVESTDYTKIANQGRLIRMGTAWGRLVTVAYVPQDDSAKRTRVIIELVRLALARTALKSENIAGEYSYTTDDVGWDAQRQRLLGSLGYPRA